MRVIGLIIFSVLCFVSCAQRKNKSKVYDIVLEKDTFYIVESGKVIDRMPAQDEVDYRYGRYEKNMLVFQKVMDSLSKVHKKDYFFCEFYKQEKSLDSVFWYNIKHSKDAMYLEKYFRDYLKVSYEDLRSDSVLNIVNEKVSTALVSPPQRPYNSRIVLERDSLIEYRKYLKEMLQKNKAYPDLSCRLQYQLDIISKITLEDQGRYCRYYQIKMYNGEGSSGDLFYRIKIVNRDNVINIEKELLNPLMLWSLID